MKLYLVRHAKTEWNALGRFQGSLDSPLTEEGVRNTEALSGKIADIQLDGVYVSELPRAKKTARILVGDRKLPIVIDKRLNEMRMGRWEGKTHAEIRNESQKLLDRYFAQEIDFSAPGGESYRALFERVFDFFRDLPKDGNYLIVTHGMTLFFLTEILRGKKIDTIGKVRILEGATLSLYEGDGVFTPIFEERTSGT